MTYYTKEHLRELSGIYRSMMESSLYDGLDILIYKSLCTHKRNYVSRVDSNFHTSSSIAFFNQVPHDSIHINLRNINNISINI